MGVYQIEVHAQVRKAFAPRTSQLSPERKIYNIKGDFTLMGNTNLTLKDYGNDLMNDNPMVFVDTDEDENTINSSSATLQFSKENNALPECTEILFAGLYWSGRSHNELTFNITKNGSRKRLDKREVKIKGPGEVGYTTLIATDEDIRFPQSLSEDLGLFVGYKDVTDYVKRHGEGEYTVADIGTIEGTNYFYGGWGIVVVYENPKMNHRDITVFDGYAFVTGSVTADFTIPISGFSSAPDGPVKIKMGIMAGEGDRAASGDFLEIEKGTNTGNFLRLSNESNDVDNFFNASISSENNPRTPYLLNNSGTDIKVIEIPNPDNKTIANNQSSTLFRYGTTWDAYVIYNITFAIDAHPLEVEGLNQLTRINKQPIEDPYPSVVPGDEIEFSLELRNKGEVEIIDGKIVIPLPETVTYLNGSIDFFYDGKDRTELFFDPNVGDAGALIWNFGDLPVSDDPERLLATFTYQLKVKENCEVLTRYICESQFDIQGEINGKNALSKVPFDGIKLIKGFEQIGSCESKSIVDPTIIGLSTDEYLKNICGDTIDNVTIVLCSFSENFLEFEEVSSKFPSGTKFFNEYPQTAQSIDFTEDNPFPVVEGRQKYFAILNEESNCHKEIIITNTTLTTEVTSGSTEFCHGGSNGEAKVEVSNGTAPFTYLWDDPMATTSASISGLSKGIYTVFVTDANGCTAIDSVEITDLEQITVSIEENNSKLNLDCYDSDEGFITILIKGGTENYHMSLKGRTHEDKAYSRTYEGVQEGSFIADNLKAGNYTVVIEDERGCTEEISFSIIQPEELIIYSEIQNLSACSGLERGSISLNISGGNPPYTYEWNNGETDEKIENLELGEYFVKVKDNNNCIIISDFKIEESLTEVSFEVSSVLQPQDSYVVFNDIQFTSEHDGDIIAFEWDFGDGSTSIEENPIHVYDKEGDYEISLNITDKLGCQVNYTQNINLIKDPDSGVEDYFLIVPEGFTPNDDNMNDFFFPKFNRMASIEFMIFNKWGETIFVTNDLNSPGWDGKMKGKDAPAGNYVYKLIITSIGGKVLGKSGVVLLIR